MTDVCAVVITAREPGWIGTFARELVSDRLCAGSHITSPIQSVYRWDGQVHDVYESHVTLHTRTEHVAEIVRRTELQHAYEVPCVVATPIVGGSPAYISWIIEQTDRG